MKKNTGMKSMWIAALVAAGFSLLVGTARAHCDTMDGPLIPEAKAALEAGDVTPTLKWIQEDNEAEVKAAFAKAVAVRAQGPEAKELADRYFLETLVRLHRAGEGAPYVGLKDEPVAPIVALADQALADGSAEAMIQKMNNHLTRAVQEKFNRALEAEKNKDKSVEAGREYVEAYVVYMHFVEGVHATLMSEGDHHPAAAKCGAEPKAAHHD